MRDLLFIATPLGQRVFQEGGGGVRLEHEGVTPEQQLKGPQIVVAARCQQVRQVDFEIAAGAGPRPLVVEAPDAAVGQDAPANPALGDRVGRGEVAQNLAVRRARPQAAARLARIERPAQTLALGDHHGVAEAVVGACARLQPAPSCLHRRTAAGREYPRRASCLAAAGSRPSPAAPAGAGSAPARSRLRWGCRSGWHRRTGGARRPGTC